MKAAPDVENRLGGDMVIFGGNLPRSEKEEAHAGKNSNTA